MVSEGTALYHSPVCLLNFLVYFLAELNSLIWSHDDKIVRRLAVDTCPIFEHLSHLWANFISRVNRHYTDIKETLKLLLASICLYILIAE